MSAAANIMRSFNRHALISEDDGVVTMIEDVMDDPGDRRWFRLEIRSTPDAGRAIAYCLHNPWGGRNGGAEYTQGHVAEDGFLCLGSEHRDRELSSSPYSLEYVIRRARYWCTAHSAFQETGEFPNL